MDSKDVKHIPHFKHVMVDARPEMIEQLIGETTHFFSQGIQATVSREDFGVQITAKPEKVVGVPIIKAMLPPPKDFPNRPSVRPVVEPKKHRISNMINKQPTTEPSFSLLSIEENQQGRLKADWPRMDSNENCPPGHRNSFASADEEFSAIPEGLLRKGWFEVSKHMAFRVLKKSDERIVRLANLHRVLRAIPNCRNAFFSASRLSAISLQCIRQLVINNDSRDFLTLCHDHFMTVTGKCSHTVNTLASLFSYLSNKAVLAASKSDVFACLVPFSHVHSIGLFKDLLRTMFTQMDEL